MSHQAAPPYPNDHDPDYQPKHRAGDPPEQEESDQFEKVHHEISVAPSKHWLRPAFLRRHPTILLTMLLIVAAIATMLGLAIIGP